MFGSIGRLLAFVGVAAVVSGAAYADDYAYTIDGNFNFQELDLHTGASTFIGNTGLLMAGIANVGSNEYGVNFDGDAQLYQIDTMTGGVTAIGSTGLSGIAFAGFGSANGQLYGLGSDANLYQVDASTGAATLVGSIGFSNWGDAWNLSTGGGQLLFTWTDDTSSSSAMDSVQHVGVLSTTDGSITDLGPFSNSNAPIGATSYIDGTWYAGGYFDPEEVDALNLGANSGTFVSNAQNMAGFWGMSGLTTSAAVPGPIAALPFLVGALARRRRR